jgi:hypothetical protein
LLSGGPIQVVVSEWKMYSACDRFIECSDPIRSEEQDTFVIFKLAQEHRYKRIADDIARRAPLHKHISFIKEENGLSAV